MDKFQEIRDRIIEQINPYSSDSMEGQDYAEDAKSVFDLLRPLLDGWKDAAWELPDLLQPVIVCLDNDADLIFRARRFENGWWAFYADGEKNIAPYVVTQWRELPSLPGDYSALEALITNKK